MPIEDDYRNSRSQYYRCYYSRWSCYIDNDGNYGLGGYLYQALDSKIPIIGVAKRAFHANKETVKEVFRGTE